MTKAKKADSKTKKEQDGCGFSRRGFITSVGAVAMAAATCRCTTNAPEKAQIAHTEWFKVYNPEARREVNPVQIIIQVLSSTDRLLEYIADTRAEIQHDFVASATTKLENTLQGYRSAMQDLDFGQLSKPLTFSNTFPENSAMNSFGIAKSMARIQSSHHWSFWNPCHED